MSEFRTEFPDYPAEDMPAMPEGFEDTSWHNDVCPSFSSSHFTIWIDYRDPALREHGGAYPRFCVQPMKDGAECSGPTIQTDDWQAVLDFVSHPNCRHRDDGRGRCIDCGVFL